MPHWMKPVKVKLSGRVFGSAALGCGKSLRFFLPSLLILNRAIACSTQEAKKAGTSWGGDVVPLYHRRQAHDLLLSDPK